MANSCRAAVMLADLGTQAQDRAFDYGRHVGLAFQVRRLIREWSEALKQWSVGELERVIHVSYTTDHYSNVCIPELGPQVRSFTMHVCVIHRRRSDPLLSSLLLTTFISLCLSSPLLPLLLTQLVDDILDFEQSSETLGKPALADIKQGLATAPVLIAAQVGPLI